MIKCQCDMCKIELNTDEITRYVVPKVMKNVPSYGFSKSGQCSPKIIPLNIELCDICATRISDYIGG